MREKWVFRIRMNPDLNASLQRMKMLFQESGHVCLSLHLLGTEIETRTLKCKDTRVILKQAWVEPDRRRT